MRDLRAGKGGKGNGRVRQGKGRETGSASVERKRMAKGNKGKSK